MSFEFHLPTLEEMRATPEGLEMLRMGDNDNFRSALISGGAGMGKTTVSIYRLVRLSNEQANVCLVTYQNLLVLAIRGLTKGLDTVSANQVSTFHKWYYFLTKTYFDTDHSPTADQMIERLQRSSLAEQGLDEILIDEGQDLPLCVYETIPRYVTRFFVGSDNAQQVHPNHGARTEQIKQALGDKYAPYKEFNLRRNFRNSYEIYRFSRQFIPRANQIVWDEAILQRLLRDNRTGPKPRVISYRDPNQRNEHLRITLKNARGNVAILCPLGSRPRNYNYSGESVDEVHQIITEMGFPASKYYSGATLPDSLERYVVTTFKSAKGLEFDVVVIPRINFFKKIPAEWYVACTRAIGRLIVYHDLGVPQCDPIAQTAQFAPDTYSAESLDDPTTTATDEKPF
ncbi:MAG: hypothetical protein QG599_3244 [Pseudomonadota bacterium]|nr:hypothetical protein [Pseudomonadota bacterium]